MFLAFIWGAYHGGRSSFLFFSLYACVMRNETSLVLSLLEETISNKPALFKFHFPSPM